MLKLISFLLMVITIRVHCLEGGENICHSEEKYTELEEKKTTQPVKIRSYNWCLSFPPRCSNYRTEIRDVIKLQNVTKTKLIEHCCEGYNNIDFKNDSTICLPLCRGGCGHGVCESPNQCECDIGYEGRHCTQRCHPRKYGKNCKNICKCKNRSLCDHKSGFCRCTTGWIGEFCESPCPKGRYGMMCHKKCNCNNNNCDPQTGDCLAENAKIVFDVSHNRSSNIMKLSSDRIKAKHWIPVNGNGKINLRNCSDPHQCTYHRRNDSVSDELGELNEDNKRTLIHQLNSNLSNLSNLTQELKDASDKSIAIVVNSSIAIHHIHKSIDAKTNQKINDLSVPSSSENNSTEIEMQDIIYDQLNEFDGVDHNIDHHDLEDSEEIDSIGGYNDIVHVFAMSSINTTKSEQYVTLPPMVPVTLILLIILCVAFAVVFGTIYFIRKSKESQSLKNNTCTHEDITLSDQIVQKPLPEIPSFTQSITRRIMQQDFYDRPSNNKSIKAGLNELGYCYAEDENNRHIDEKCACDEHIYDEIKYSNYRETTQR